MPKRASDYAEEVCYTGKTWQKQHKSMNCRYLKNREIIQTNRREAYLKGAKSICVYCWFETEIGEYVTSFDWTLTCKVPGCNWTSYGERTEDFIDEMNEDVQAHREYHREEQ
jgi:hypothetical protein